MHTISTSVIYTETARKGGFFMKYVSSFFHLVCLVSLILLACLLYWPGLQGGFILDDLGILPRLGELGGIHDTQGLLRFLASDISGPGGRPISLLSFLANYNNWPADPWPFKLTNLLLHLLSGALLFRLAGQIIRIKDSQASAAHWVAALVAGYWLLNPFNVSTVLYIVQRMTILSALFVLAGLCTYVYGRQLLARQPTKSYLVASAAPLLFTPLAALSKENGALLPVLALVLEYTALRHGLHLATPSRTWTMLFLWLPSAAVLAMLTLYAGAEAYAVRPFTLGERLLSEARALLDYVYHWFTPLAIGRGVMTDDFVLSTGLFSPWTTLPAVAVVLGAFAWAIAMRKRYPWAALAILFFLAGHAMESTLVPLELYFAHRNYLPAMFLFLPLADWGLRQQAKWRWLPLLAGVLFAVMSWQTYRLSSVWGNPWTLSAWWAEHQPDSARAQDFFASTLADSGRPELAAAFLAETIGHHPENGHFYLHHLWQQCHADGVGQEEWARLRRELSVHPVDIKSRPLLADLISQADSPQCRGVDSGELLAVVNILADHPTLAANSPWLGELRHMQGELLLKSRQPAQALTAFGQALQIRPDLSLGLLQVALLGTHHYYAEGLAWLGRVGKLPRPAGWREQLRSWDYDAEIEHLRHTLVQDLPKQGLEISSGNR